MNEAQLSYWKKLLHYKTALNGKLKSEVVSDQFFVSSQGHENPLIELASFVQAVSSPRGQEIVCRFPLRYKWIKENFKNNWSLNLDKCENYQSFVSKLDAKNISLVFSSFYINNPGSTFGHTFLRVSRYDEFQHNELLDYAINFAAQESRDPLLAYMFKGLAGFYPGQFSVVPYYYKIREYNDREMRDIWDYDLELTTEQIQKVVDHTWELSQAKFDYYYLNRNCSYQILSLLDVAYDGNSILSHLNSYYVLPLETVQILDDLKQIKASRLRPSSYQRLLEATQGFSASELEEVKNISITGIVKDKDFGLNQSRQAAKKLEASILALDYFEADKVLMNHKETLERRHKILVQRAKNPFIEDEDSISINIENPLQAHRPSRFGFSMGDRNRHGIFEGVEWRAANHDLLDPPLGHSAYAQVVLLDLKFRLQTQSFHQQNLILDKAMLIDLKNYRPASFWDQAISYDFNMGFDQRRDCLSQNCLSPFTSFAVGNSVSGGSDHVLSFLLGGKYEYDTQYKNHSLLSFGPKINWLHFFETNALALWGQYFFPYEVLGNWQEARLSFGGEWRYFISHQLNFHLKASHQGLNRESSQEAQAGFYVFY